MSSFNYKAQVQIVVASMTIHNYIRRTSLQDMVFMEFDRHPNYVPDDLFTDIAPTFTSPKKSQAFAYELGT